MLVHLSLFHNSIYSSVSNDVILLVWCCRRPQMCYLQQQQKRERTKKELLKKVESHGLRTWCVTVLVLGTVYVTASLTSVLQSTRAPCWRKWCCYPSEIINEKKKKITMAWMGGREGGVNPTVILSRTPNQTLLYYCTVRAWPLTLDSLPVHCRRLKFTPMV